MLVQGNVAGVVAHPFAVAVFQVVVIGATYNFTKILWRCQRLRARVLSGGVLHAFPLLAPAGPFLLVYSFYRSALWS